MIQEEQYKINTYINSIKSLKHIPVSFHSSIPIVDGSG